MADRAILVITHGEFGIEMIKSAEMIMGPMADASGLGLRPGESVEDLRNDAIAVVEKNTAAGKETVVLCDLLGGSPSNAGLFLLSKGVQYVMTGVSLPMLIDLYSNLESEQGTEALLQSVQENTVAGVRLLDINFLKNK